VAQLVNKIAEVTPPPCCPCIWCWHQYFKHPYWRAGSAGSSTFRECLLSAFTIADTMACKTFVTLCRTVTSPWQLLVPPQF
jgi:hypothetical protein